MIYWTGASFCIHFVVGVLVTEFTSAWRYLGPDALYYQLNAHSLAAHWNGIEPAVPAELTPGKEGFSLLLGALYSLFGEHPATGLAVNAAFSAALVPLVSDTTARLFGPRAARLAWPLAALFPSLLFWTSQLLREAGILFLLALAANSATRLRSRITTANVTVLAVAISVLFTFRSYVAVWVAPALMVGVVIAKRRIVNGFALMAIVSTLLVLLVGVVGLGRGGYDFVRARNLETANAVRLGLTETATSRFDVETDVSTASDVLRYIPRGLPNVLVGPFPWHVRSVRHILGLLDAIFLWTMIPSFVRGVREARRTVGLSALAPHAFAAAVTAVIVMVVVGNFGTIVRSRMQVIVFLLPVWALGIRSGVDSGALRMPTTRFFAWLSRTSDGARRTHASGAVSPQAPPLRRGPRLVGAP